MGKELQDLKDSVAKLLKENSSIKSQITSNDKKNNSNTSPNPEADLKNTLLEQISKELAAVR